MRIISQGGTIDVPYEMVVIQRFRNAIYFLNRNLTGVENLVSDITLAEYSTEAKAIKAMKMLREEYFETEHEKTYRDGVYYFLPVFQFPKDDEVEV